MEFGLRGRKIAVLAGNGLAKGELEQALKGIETAGADLFLVGGCDADASGLKLRTASFDSAAPENFAALVLAGGNCSALAGNQRATALVRTMMESDKPVAVIGRGAEILVAADAVSGRTVAADASLRDAIEKAGGTWVDKSIQVDQKLISTTGGTSLAAFAKRLSTEIANKLDSTKVDQLSQQSFPASDPPPGPVSIGVTRKFGDETRA
jgi:protease I